MTVIPQLQQALTEAAAAPARRRRVVGHAARPVIALAVIAVLLTIVARPLLEPDRQASGLPAVPQKSVEKATALAALPDPIDESSPSNPVELTDFVQQLQAAVPYPPGRTDDDLPQLIARQATARPGSARNMSQISTKRDVRSQTEYRAACAWQQFWLAAHDDRNAQHLATEVLQSVPRWPSFRPARPPENALATAARTGDTALIQAQVDANCGTRPR